MRAAALDERRTFLQRRAAEVEERLSRNVAERLRAEQEERQRRLTQRDKLSAALREAKELRQAQQRELARLRGELDSAEGSLKKTQDLIADLEQQLQSL